MKQFSIGEAVQFGWNTVKQNLGFFLGLIGIVLLISWAPSFIIDIATNGKDLGALGVILGLVIYVVLFVVNTLISMGLLRISLAFIDGRKPSHSELFTVEQRKLIHYIVFTFLYTIVAMLISLIFIVPGMFLFGTQQMHWTILLVGIVIWLVVIFYYSLMYQMGPYLIIDKEVSFLDAFKQSSEITKGKRLNLLLFWLVLLLINILGALALIIGLLITVPISWVASAYVYRKLLNGKAEAPAAVTKPQTSTTKS